MGGFFNEIVGIMEERKVKSVLILCHKNADPDAVCSSYALIKLLKNFKPEIEVEIASPESVSKVSKGILERFSMRVENEEPDFDKADIIFMLDTSTVQQLGEWGKNLHEAASPIIVIDHHAPHQETGKITSLYICREDFSSTCEIIYSFFKEAGVKPSKDVAEALFLGIAFDTRHFTLAPSSTFKVIADLVDLGVDAQEVLQLLLVPMDVSERIARLKACRRMRLMRIYGWIIVFSHVGSFQASAARALVDVGASLAIIGSQDKDKISISLRSSNEFRVRTGIHLGRDLAKILGEYLHGMGGGHSTSAGVNGTGDLEEAFKYAARVLKERL
ncbi:MAG: DHH family phosphoesterase, partial [Candidatus Bathyarchaeota archaeon]|nr:DHH family phosphoesterase [Candidatus Bathyarchaeota archaeon]